MKLTLNIEKRYIIAILAGVLVLAGVLTAFAYNPTNTPPANPSAFGHTLNEIDGITCTAGQALTRTASGWSCVGVTSAAENCVFFNSTVKLWNQVKKTGKQRINVPAKCAVGHQCRLVILEYNDHANSGTPTFLGSSIISYYQANIDNPTPNNPQFWMVNSIFGNLAGYNGNTDRENIFVSTNDPGNLYISDDDPGNGNFNAEDQDNQWVIMDDTAQNGMDIYVCG